MIKKNGISAFSDNRYDYYKLIKDFGILKEGAIFVHDTDDSMYGSIAQGCLKLCWTPDGNCYSNLCANTVFLHYSFVRDESLFMKIKNSYDRDEIIQTIEEMESQLLKLKKVVDIK